MELEARGIIIYKSVEMAEELNESLLPEIRLTDYEVRRTLLKGIQSFRESDFDICFISDSFSLAELKPFFSDIKALKGDGACVFVQVREALGEGVQRNSLSEAGFSTIINHNVTDGDKSSIAESLKELLAKQEIKKRRIDVESAMKLIMLEVDRVAKDRKRGIDRPFSRDMLAGFVDDQLDFHSEVMDAYMKALDKLSDQGKPVKDLIVSLPEHMIEKNLPGIVDGQYAGASLRVWEMLREKFGKEAGSVQDNETEVIDLNNVKEADATTSTTDSEDNDQVSPEQLGPIE
jgi:hypothetical protein